MSRLALSAISDLRHGRYYLDGLLADHCDGCTMCRFARDNPSHWFGKVMEWHGRWCPAWRAWKEKYGNKGVTDAGSRAS